MCIRDRYTIRSSHGQHGTQHTAGQKRTATSTIANGGSGDVTGEAWMGTRDDYVGSSDSPTKTIGSLTASGFSTTGANTVEIKSGDEVVYVTSPDTGSQGLIDSSFSGTSFSGIYEQTTSALPSSQSDGGYGVYVNFGTIPAGGEVSRQIIYAAGAVDVIAQVAQAASEGGPVVEEEAVPEAVETAIATAVAATVTTSVATSVGASVGSVRGPRSRPQRPVPAGTGRWSSPPLSESSAPTMRLPPREIGDQK